MTKLAAPYSLPFENDEVVNQQKARTLRSGLIQWSGRPLIIRAPNRHTVPVAPCLVTQQSPCGSRGNPNASLRSDHTPVGSSGANPFDVAGAFWRGHGAQWRRSFMWYIPQNCGFFDWVGYVCSQSNRLAIDSPALMWYHWRRAIWGARSSRIKHQSIPTNQREELCFAN